MAAAEVGNDVLTNCARWLIFVNGVQTNIEGVEVNEGFFGGSLQGVANHPVLLSDPTKLIYSPHAYGPSNNNALSWWNDDSFPSNMPAVWDAYFGYIAAQPVVLAAWGSNLREDSPLNIKWTKAIVDYLSTNKIGSFVWAFNPNVQDIDGLTTGSWTENTELLETLEPLPTSDVQVLVDAFSKCIDGGCLGNGVCKDDMCECKVGWFGPQCEFCSQGDKSSCSSSGKCSAVDTCECITSFSGVLCENNLCSDVNCGNESAQCVANAGQEPACFCKTGCQGSSCTACSANGEDGMKKCDECSDAHRKSTSVFLFVLISMMTIVFL